MGYDLTDYTQYLEYEREDGYRQLLADMREQELAEKQVEHELLDLEVKYMLEMI